MPVRATSSFLCLATALLAQAPSAEELVARLTDDTQRAAAHAALLSLGRGAVQALVARLADADEQLFGEVLASLLELGPQGGAAFAAVLAAVDRHPRHVVRAVATLAELTPWRGDAPAHSPGMLYTRVAEVLGSSFGADRAAWRAALRRLQARGAFPRELDVVALTECAQGTAPLRVELAVEWLGQHGADARAALPALARLLEQSDPVVLATGDRVAIRRKAARAVLSIDPDGAFAARARAIVGGAPVVAAPSPPVPQRLRQRVAALVGELAIADRRADAAVNLVALGEAAVPTVAAVLSTAGADHATVVAALTVLRDLGPRAASAVPALLDATTGLSTEYTLAVLDALIAIAPWSRDVVPLLDLEGGVGGAALFGRPLHGTVDAALLTGVMQRSARLTTVLTIDCDATVVELGGLLESPWVVARERALEVLPLRGERARPLLPALGGMLAAPQPAYSELFWPGARPAGADKVDRSVHVHRLAARAILAIAADDAPLRAAAERVLAEQSPK
jgi:hypothetical protein